MSYENQFPTDPQDASEPKPNAFRRIGGHFQSKMLGGLLEVLPVLITVIVIVYIVNFIDGIMAPVITFLVDRGLAFPYMEEVLTFPGIGIVVGVIIFIAMNSPIA